MRKLTTAALVQVLSISGPLHVSSLSTVFTAAGGPQVWGTGLGMETGGMAAGTGAGDAELDAVHLQRRHLGSAISGICLRPSGLQVNCEGVRQNPLSLLEPHWIICF